MKEAHLNNLSTPVLGIIGFSGSGKTTLLTKVISQLTVQGFRVGVVKHAHHRFDIDHPGKDSYMLRQAGAAQTLVASQHRWALMVETPGRQHDPQLPELLTHIDKGSLDLVLVEGFKHASYPKLEVHRPSVNPTLLYPHDPDIIALLTDDTTLSLTKAIAVLDMNNTAKIVQFIEQFIRNRHD